MTFAIISKPTPKNSNPSYLAPSLNKASAKVEFNPAKAEHRKAYVEYKQTGKWTIQFETKWPKSIQQTVEEKLALHACRKECLTN